MPQYRLAQKADHGLLNIASYGIEQCWAERSRRYDSKLKERFDERAEQPERYPLVEHIRKGYRRSVYGVPSIYYRIDGETWKSYGCQAGKIPQGVWNGVLP